MSGRTSGADPRSRAGGGDAAGAPADLVRRDFAPRGPDVVWAGDITFIPTTEGCLHLAVVLDLGSRRLLGYAMATTMRTQLVGDALHIAAGARGGRTAGIVFHSDRGGQGGFKWSSQYLAGEHSAALARYRMRQ